MCEFETVIICLVIFTSRKFNIKFVFKNEFVKSNEYPMAKYSFLHK